MNAPFEEWETIIGIETHVALNTQSKLFSSAPNRFGSPPNTHVTAVCTGQPGSLPVLNREAVRKAIQFGCAIQGQVAHFSQFDRKSYFYPDSPRNFQITQFEHPIILGGQVLAEVEGEIKTFTVNRAHLEDDAGMLKHFPHFTALDDNRAGVPLIEIVSDPCLHSPKDAVAYGMALKAILEYLDVSDCDMEKGSLRMDANISVRKKGELGLRNKVEIKNMNSFSNMEKALESEIRRQIREYQRHEGEDPSEVIHQATYRWDPDRKETIMMRLKENSDDYRYFPEPDLLPIVLSEEAIDQIRKELPELPYERFNRYVQDLQLPREGAAILCGEKAHGDFFEEALPHCHNPKALCLWLTVEFAGRFRDLETDIWNSGIQSLHVANLIRLLDEGLITGKIAKKVADEMLKSPGKDCEDIVKENPDYQPLSDLSAIEAAVDATIGENPASIASFRAGKTQAFGYLVGQVMKKTRGKAPPQLVNELLKQKLGTAPA